MTFEVKHGSFGYGKGTVLNDISFSVSSGEVLAVLGSNGVGKTTLLYDSLSVKTEEGMVELPQKEFMLLFKLLSYPNKIYTRRQLMDEIWDMDSESDERTVDVHISRVRDRFRGSEDFEIVTVRGLGYKAILHK